MQALLTKDGLICSVEKPAPKYLTPPAHRPLLPILPPEILDEICSHLDKGTLSDLTVTCKSLETSARQALFSHIEIQDTLIQTQAHRIEARLRGLLSLPIVVTSATLRLTFTHHEGTREYPCILLIAAFLERHASTLTHLILSAVGLNTLLPALAACRNLSHVTFEGCPLIGGLHADEVHALFAAQSGDVRVTYTTIQYRYGAMEMMEDARRAGAWQGTGGWQDLFAVPDDHRLDMVKSFHFAFHPTHWWEPDHGHGTQTFPLSLSSLVSVSFLQHLTRLRIYPANVYHFFEALRPKDKEMKSLVCQTLPQLSDFQVDTTSEISGFYDSLCYADIDIDAQVLELLEAFPNLQNVRFTASCLDTLGFEPFLFSRLPTTLCHVDLAFVYDLVDAFDGLVSLAAALLDWLGDLRATANLETLVLRMDWEKARIWVLHCKELVLCEGGEEGEAAHLAAIQQTAAWYPAVMAKCPGIPEDMAKDDFNDFLHSYDVVAYFAYREWVRTYEGELLWAKVLHNLAAIRAKLDERGIRYLLDWPTQKEEAVPPRGEPRGKPRRAHSLKQLTL